MKRPEAKKGRRHLVSEMDYVLSAAVRSIGMPGVIRQGRVFAAWAEAVGPVTARKTRPVAIRNDVLLVKSEDPAWTFERTQDEQFKKEVLAKIKSLIKGRPPKDIRFITGQVEDEKPRFRTFQRVTHIRVDAKKVSASIDDSAVEHNEKLKNVLTSLVRNSYRLRKQKHDR
jgi:Dna[CI] antecedent, DciA